LQSLDLCEFSNALLRQWGQESQNLLASFLVGKSVHRFCP
jgi:hypothetical protein